ncbi:phosphatidylglycerol lysyltransferase domain-containing protein [Roseobacteraceae bacterium S113]
MLRVFEAVPSPVRRLGQQVLQNVVPLGLGLFCIWSLWGQIQDVDNTALWARFHQITLAQWALALAATAVSFWALGRYDVHMHAHCKTLVPPQRAARAGLTAIAIAQTTGLAAIVSGLIRWKMLQPLGAMPVAAVTASVSVVFVLGWVLFLGLSAALPGAPMPWWIAPLSVFGLIVFLAASVVRPLWPGRDQSMPLPSVPHLLRMTCLAALDLGGAAVAFFVLLPTDAALTFAAFLPIFLLAFGAGLYSGTPGGLGPFELALLAFLSSFPAPELLATIVAFRLVYYALPAALACISLAHDHFTTRTLPTPVKRQPHLPLSQTTRAEAGLIRQNGGRMRVFGGTSWPAVDTGQTDVALFDPLAGCVQTALPLMRNANLAAGRLSLLYKIAPRTAAAARREGWHAMHLSDDAILSPMSFDLRIPARKRLRRKLRAARNAGVTVRAVMPVYEHRALSEVAQDWHSRNGRERGVSMGRFRVDALENQLVLGAFVDEKLVAFASFHETEHEMCLDLMRQGDFCPDGAMHKIIIEAIEHGKRHQTQRLSLAAAPAQSSQACGAFHAHFLRLIETVSGGAGLRQFKSSFAPDWERRFVAAPNRIIMLLALADMARAIHWPDNIARA